MRCNKKKIIANGDIVNKLRVDELKSVGVVGVMIGRAAITNPGIFNELKGIKTKTKKEILGDFVDLSLSYGEPFRYIKNVLKHNKMHINDFKN